MSTYCVPKTTLGALLALAHLILTTAHSGDIITIIIINIPIIQMRTLRHGEAREDPSQSCLIPNPACRPGSGCISCRALLPPAAPPSALENAEGDGTWPTPADDQSQAGAGLQEVAHTVPTEVNLPCF